MTDLRRVKVAIDVSPALAETTGIGTYVRELAKAAVEADPAGIALIGVRADGPVADLAKRAAGSTVLEGARRRWLVRGAAADARRVGAGLVHYTNGMIPLRSEPPHVLTIHDLSVLRHPTLHPPGRWPTVPIVLLAALRARAIIVPSTATAREVERVLGRWAPPITVIGHAPATSPAEGDDILRRLGLQPGRYILSVAAIERRKNLLRLIGAFERLAADAPGLSLVLVGRAVSGAHAAEIAARADESPLAARIHIVGYVSDADRDALVRGCAALAYVSLHEGFGLPVIDALALGAPVVASRRAAVPETAAGAAVLVDPRDEGAIARGLAVALADRDRLATAGRRRTAGMTWARVADAHLDVYRRVLSGRSR